MALVREIITSTKRLYHPQPYRGCTIVEMVTPEQTYYVVRHDSLDEYLDINGTWDGGEAKIFSTPEDAEVASIEAMAQPWECPTHQDTKPVNTMELFGL
jgi:hypothetical protein